MLASQGSMAHESFKRMLRWEGDGKCKGYQERQKKYYLQILTELSHGNHSKYSKDLTIGCLPKSHLHHFYSFYLGLRSATNRPRDVA